MDKVIVNTFACIIFLKLLLLQRFTFDPSISNFNKLILQIFDFDVEQSLHIHEITSGIINNKVQ